MIQFSDQEIVGKRLVLDSKTDLYYLGHNLTLRDCNCIIDVKRELRNFPWSGASLKGCRVTGRLIGADFGRWMDGGYWWEQASISDCDFSGARLDCCRFHECDPRTLKFPRWPCFTILDPIANSQKLRSVEWPGSFGPIVIEHLHEDPVSTVAVTYHAPSAAKRDETTAEALRAVIEKFDCIIY